jgi:hypothetical protein
MFFTFSAVILLSLTTRVLGRAALKLWQLVE